MAMWCCLHWWKHETSEKTYNNAQSQHSHMLTNDYGMNISRCDRVKLRFVDISFIKEYRVYDINRRIFLVMRFLGLGRKGINIFAELMGVGRGVNLHAYILILRHICDARSAVFESVCKKAVTEGKQSNVQNEQAETDFKVYGNGLWKKRGFTSLFGVTSLIGYYRGKKNSFLS